MAINRISLVYQTRLSILLLRRGDELGSCSCLRRGDKLGLCRGETPRSPPLFRCARLQEGPPKCWVRRLSGESFRASFIPELVSAEGFEILLGNTVAQLGSSNATIRPQRVRRRMHSELRCRTSWPPRTARAWIMLGRLGLDWFASTTCSFLCHIKRITAMF